MRSVPTPRLLPAIMTFGALLLGTKLFSLGTFLISGIAPIPASVVTQAAAAPATEKEAVPTPPAKPEPGLAAAAKQAPTAATESLQAPPPPVVSEAERQLLQDLRSRRQELDARERSLAEREGVLDAAEQRIKARVSQLSDLQAKLEQLEAQRQQHEEANWAGLVRIYEVMKPRDAANIFNDMDVPVLLEVAGRMKEAKMALVLAAMQPDRARLVTTRLAAQRTKALEVPSANPTSG